MLDHQGWKSRAASLRPQGRAFIDGAFTDALSGKTFDSINPATGAVLAQVAECDAEDANRAVAAAYQPSEGRPWLGISTARTSRP